MNETSPHVQLDRMITGYWLSQAIYAAAKFGIADLVAGGPRSVDELAQQTATNRDALYRLLRALASVGIFREGPAQNFSLTPLAEPLQSNVPGSKRALALMSGDEQFRAWSEIVYSIQTGKKAFDKVFGKPIFDYLSEHHDKAQIFDAAMVGIHGRESGAVLKAYDFSGINTVVDIGGGNGSQLIALLQAHPTMRGILFDLPHVVERAKAPIAAAGLAERCQLVAGSFFDTDAFANLPLPLGEGRGEGSPGSDAGDSDAVAYFMRHIIHDWDDEKCLTILRNCHRAMPADGRLLVVESVIPPGNEPFGSKFLDLVMLLIPGGKERTEEEYRDLFAQAGFALSKIVPTGSEVSVIEAVKR
ncbi:MAG TPA: methyltransferase [Lacipirellulaceae bacterium]|nr:methyltransferase [Lacipirellulaceae bacterium]